MEKEFVKTEYGKPSGRILNFRPCFFTAVFLALGIVFADLTIVYAVPKWWGIVVPILTFGSYLLSRKRSVLVACAVLILAFTVGFFAYSEKATAFTSNPYIKKKTSVYGRVVSSCLLSEHAQMILDGVTVDGGRVDGKICVLFPKDFFDVVNDSDYVFVDGEVKTDNALTGKEKVFPNQFAEDIRYVCFSYVSPRTVKRAFDPFAYFRERMERVLYASMTEDSASVAYAILTGETSGIDNGLLENVRAGGIAHVFAVSGLHVGTLFGVATFLISKSKRLKRKKWLRFTLVALFLALYGGVCGYSSSVLRSGITCLVGYATTLIGVKFDKIESLSLAGILLLLLNPVYLFCVGFQLTFTACYGIFFLAKPIQVWLERGYRSIFHATTERDLPCNYSFGKREKLFSFLSVTLSAQCATAPILLNSFGYLSTWGFLLNCLFVPLFGTLYTCTFACVALSCLFPLSFASVLNYLPNLVWSSVLLVFEIVELSTILNGVVLSFSAFLAYYLCFLFCTDKFCLSKKWKGGFLMLFLACFVLSILFIL